MTRIIEDVKLDFKDVLILPKRSEIDSRSKVSLERTHKFKHSPHTYTGIPIVAANMDHTGTMEVADVLASFNMSTALHKFYTVKQLVVYFDNLYHAADKCGTVFYSMGITKEDLEKFKTVQEQLTHKLQYVCVDVANGYSRKFVSFVEQLREQYPDLVIMAGNVVTPDMTYDLLERGADIVKIGIGPGSVCTTRKITGVGYPQLSAIMECADAAHGANGLICGDGGITSPGDIAKAFAGGADFVMCGGIFAGHDECSGSKTRGKIRSDVLHQLNNAFEKFKHAPEFTFHIIKLPNGTDYIADFSGITQALSHDDYCRKIFDSLPNICFEPVPQTTMKFYGMSSKEAMDKHYGGKADYRASEGKVVEVPYKGPVSNTVEEILGGLRSACTYVGARNLKQLPKCTTFVRVSRILNDMYE